MTPLPIEPTLDGLLSGLGGRFRKLVLHSDGTWVATSKRDYENSPNKPGIGMRAATPQEALIKLKARLLAEDQLETLEDWLVKGKYT